MKLKDNIKNYSFGKGFKLLVIWAIILIIGFTFSTICIPFLGPDSGFYLKIALDLHNGLSFYRDLHVAYTPLGMYMLQGVFGVFPSGGLSVFYTLIVLLYAVSALLFYSILKHLNINKKQTRLFTALMLVSLFELDGANIQLEPFVLVFELAGILFLLNWVKKPNILWLLGSGLSCFFAFYSKQYGLSVAIAFVWYIYINRLSSKQFITNIVVFGSGLFVPAILVVIYFFQHHIPVVEIIKKVIGIDYLAGYDKVTGIGYNFLLFLESIGRFIGDLPVVLVLIFPAFQKNKPSISHNTIFIGLLILGSCFQLFFAGYRHYYQLISPYILLLIPLILNNIHQNSDIKFQRYFFFLSIIFLTASTAVMINRIVERNKHLNYQERNTILINKIIPRGQKVYLQGISPAYYFLCDFNSPENNLLGYRFPEEMRADFISKSLPSGTFIIVDNCFFKKNEFSTRYFLVSKFVLSGGKECAVLQKQ